MHEAIIKLVVSLLILAQVSCLTLEEVKEDAEQNVINIALAVS